ncbi:reverse transcriptase domain-containing protein [Tanacetum coccineum]
MELPTLTTLEQKEALFVYLIASREAVSGVLVANRKGKQLPVRLRRYFEAHLIQVITDQPIKQILNKPEVSGKLAKYAIELGAYNITYIPRTTVKGQRGVRAGLVLIDTSGMEYTYAIRLTFSSTNNEVEYEALLAGLRIARKIKVQLLDVKVDSKLVAYQMNREFVASSEGMEKYLAKAKKQVASFKKFSIKNIPRNQNQKADVLSKLASVAFNHLTKEILVEVLNAKSIDVEEVSTIVEGAPNEDKPICDGGRSVVQEVIPLPDAKVCRPITSKLHNKGSTRRGVRNVRRSEIRGDKDHEARVLLAEHAWRYEGSGRQM